MIISKKVRLVPNKQQESQLYKSANTARYIYNWALYRQIENFQQGNKFISASELRKELTKLKQKSEFKWLFDVSNNVTKQAVKDLCLAYSKFFKIQKDSKTKGYSVRVIERAKRLNKKLTAYELQGHPKFKSKKFSKLSFYNDICKLKVKENRALLEKIGWVKVSEKLEKSIKYLNPRISFDGKYWYLSVSYEVNNTSSELTNESLGIDVGIKDLAITSNKKVYPNINKINLNLKILKRRLKRLQRKVSRKYLMNKKDDKFIKTKNIVKIESLIKLLNRRINNIRTNYNHQVTSEIVKAKPSKIVMEDLNIKGMMKNRHLSKAIQEQGLYKFIEFVKYKSLKLGIKFFQVNRFFPSSKMCSSCFNIKKDLKLSNRFYHCSECGLEIDRDYNASLNLSKFSV